MKGNIVIENEPTLRSHVWKPLCAILRYTREVVVAINMKDRDRTAVTHGSEESRLDLLLLAPQTIGLCGRSREVIKSTARSNRQQPDDEALELHLSIPVFDRSPDVFGRFLLQCLRNVPRIYDKHGTCGMPLRHHRQHAVLPARTPISTMSPGGASAKIAIMAAI